MKEADDRNWGRRQARANFFYTRDQEEGQSGGKCRGGASVQGDMLGFGFKYTGEGEQDKEGAFSVCSGIWLCAVM